MNVIDFLDKYEIDWFPINLNITTDHNTRYSNGELKKIKNLQPIDHELYKRTTDKGYISYKPSPSDFIDLPPHIIKARQQLYYSKEIKFNSVWIDTGGRYKQIDIDTPEYAEGYKKLLDIMPYFKSKTKSFGRHIFIESDFIPSKQKYIFNDNKEIEYLSGQPAYCDIHAEIINGDIGDYKCDGVKCNDECDKTTCKLSSMGFKGIESLLKIDKRENITITKFKNITDKDKETIFTRLNTALSFDVNTKWDISTTSNGYKLTPNTTCCIVNPKEPHKHRGHSCIFISKRNATGYCFSHGSVKINSIDILNVRKTLGLIKNDLSSGSGYGQKIRHKIEIDDDITEHILLHLTTTHEQVASLFKKIYSDEFICACEKGNREWYSYKDGLWYEVGESKISKLISEDFVNILINYKIHLEYKSNDPEFCKKYNTSTEAILTFISIMSDVIIKCETTGYITSITKQLIQKYIVDKFVEKLDMKTDLLCFGKNTYDLEKNTWRETRRDDYFSKKCGVSMEEVSDEHVLEMIDIINSIFTDTDERDYFLYTLSDCLKGKNEKEVFHIWQGGGGNGKGLIASFIEEALGDYYATGNISLLTNKSDENPNSASPAKINLRGVRIAMFSEPPLYAKLNNATMNSWTGGKDKMCGRGLFKDFVCFVPQFTPIIQCNTTFKLQNIEDESIPRRLILTKFKRSFVDEPKYSHQGKRNNKLKSDETIQRLKGAMMFIMLDTWKYLSPDHKFSIPTSVKADKEEYLGENDSLGRFIEEKVEITESDKDYIKVKDLLTEYRNYLTENREGSCKDTLKRFQNKLLKYLPEYKDRYSYYVEGVQVRIRSVYVKCKFKNE
jgi:P4 family phage/plasmid primase-like protien